MRSILLGIGMMVLFVGGARRAAGQTGVEFGVDAAYERVSASSEALGNPTFSIFALPMQTVRVGFYLQDAVSVEPRFGFTRISSEDGSSNTQVRASLAGLYLLGQADGGDPRLFLSLVTGLDYGKVALEKADASVVQLRAGGGAGIHLPVRGRLLFRSSAEYHRSFESRKALAASHIIIAVGFSFTFPRS